MRKLGDATDEGSEIVFVTVDLFLNCMRRFTSSSSRGENTPVPVLLSRILSVKDRMGSALVFLKMPG